MDPIDAACEILWFNGIVVVASAGNNAGSALRPGERPLRHHRGRHRRQGHGRPERRHAGGLLGLRAQRPTARPSRTWSRPGTNIVSLMAGARPRCRSSTRTTWWTRPTAISACRARRWRRRWFRGRSAAAQDEPGPHAGSGQVPAEGHRCAMTRDWPGYDATRAGAGYLDAYAAVNSTTTDERQHRRHAAARCFGPARVR